MVIYTYSTSLHTRVDGSILAGAFLTSSFCAVPESSHYTASSYGMQLVTIWTAYNVSS